MCWGPCSEPESTFPATVQTVSDWMLITCEEASLFLMGKTTTLQREIQMNQRLSAACGMLALLLVAAVGTGCGSPNKSPEVAKNAMGSLTVADRNVGASNAILGSIGFKRYGNKGPAWFERQRVPGWKSVQVYTSAIVTVDNTIEQGLKDAGVELGKLFSASGKAFSTSANKYKLTTLQVRDPSDLAEEIERLVQSDQKLAGLLAMESVRIVTSVSSIFDSELIAKHELTVDMKASAEKVAGDDGLSLRFNAGKTSNFNLKIGD